jgi:hypothetical protein
MDNLDFYKQVAIEIAEAQGHSVDKDRLDEVFPAILGGAARLVGSALKGAARVRAASKLPPSHLILKTLDTRKKAAAEKKAKEKKAKKEKQSDDSQPYTKTNDVGFGQ